MPPITTIMTILSLILGSLITFSSHSWMLAWLGLELNTLAIIPLMTKSQHPRANEAATKYFLAQAMASALMMSAIILNNYLTGNLFFISHRITPTLIFTVALAIKMGMTPFHFWLPDVLQGLPLSTGLIMSTWQKFPSLALFIQLSHHLDLKLLVPMGLASTVVGALGGINQTQIRKILAYSSIANLGWLAAVVKLCPHLALFNFFIYAVLTSALFIMFMALKALNMPKLMMSWANSPAIASAAVLTLLSLAGLPPLTGFMPKLLITQELLNNDYILVTAIMFFTTLLTLFFYLRMAYIMTLTMSSSTSYSVAKWYRAPKSYSPIPVTLSILLIVLLPLFPTVL
uniref:NADH-ubiquinone oxidoreductase chain 2 n=1 Tax=Craugastor cf. mexicanus UTA A-55247 TaxID=230664 RepID=Q53ED6_9NEOB|nr:NADH dehydrogenase subunit II [Craugastor cf. mexicanus UTA A-55247]